MLSPLHHSKSLALYINHYCRNVSTISATLDNMMTSLFLTRREFHQYSFSYFNGVFIHGVKNKQCKFKNVSQHRLK